jgi:hypothetical protein
MNDIFQNPSEWRIQRETPRETRLNASLRIVTMAMVAILMFDAICLLAWIASGQQPVDGFYFGAITNNIINLCTY